MKPSCLFIYLEPAIKHLSIFIHLEKAERQKKIVHGATKIVIPEISFRKNSFKLHPFDWFSIF
jgi:hypothetical protein